MVPLARTLFAEYGRAIADVAGCSLQFQGFDSELDGLPGLYAPPRGCILLALVDQPGGGESLAGCIAMRPLAKLGPEVCEMKRMYVRPAFRRLGIGRLLVDRLLYEARSAGYERMKLDTSCSMHPAMALYRQMGFSECVRYNDDPMEDTVWFDRAL